MLYRFCLWDLWHCLSHGSDIHIHGFSLLFWFSVSLSFCLLFPKLSSYLLLWSEVSCFWLVFKLSIMMGHWIHACLISLLYVFPFALDTCTVYLRYLELQVISNSGRWHDYNPDENAHRRNFAVLNLRVMEVCLSRRYFLVHVQLLSSRYMEFIGSVYDTLAWLLVMRKTFCFLTDCIVGQRLSGLLNMFYFNCIFYLLFLYLMRFVIGSQHAKMRYMTYVYAWVGWKCQWIKYSIPGTLSCLILMT